MKDHFIIKRFLGILMLSSALITFILTPTKQGDSLENKLNLETIIPLEFENWRIDPSSEILMINPDTQGLLNKIYSQTLSRTYINNNAERVMLSIAYGRDQSTDLHIHRPEICYASSGFEVSRMTKSLVETKVGRIPVMRMVAKQGTRNEPITYWIRVGDSLTRGWIEQKLAVIAYGLTGKAPDGLLFRISNVSNDEQDSYRIQQTFLTAILQAMHSEDRHWLIGHLPS